MAIPSGGGTEVLKRNSIANQAQTFTEVNWLAEQTSVTNTTNGAVPANTIITVLSIIWTNQSAAVSNTSFRIEASGRDNIELNSDQAIPAWGTYVWNDKFVLHPTDKLKFYNSQVTDIWLSYIYQDWTT